MSFSQAFVLPYDYFIYFSYSGKSEYPIFFAAKVKHTDEHDTVDIYVQFSFIWFLLNNDIKGLCGYFQLTFLTHQASHLATGLT